MNVEHSADFKMTNGKVVAVITKDITRASGTMCDLFCWYVGDSAAAFLPPFSGLSTVTSLVAEEDKLALMYKEVPPTIEKN